MIVDIVLISLFIQILVQILVLQVSGRFYDTRLVVLTVLQVHFVLRLVYNIVVESYPHLSIIAMLDAKLRAEGHNPHPHAPLTHAG